MMKRIRLVGVILAILVAVAPALYAALIDNITVYWSLDDTPNDSVGSNHLTLTGSPSYAAGKINNALSLDGSTQYASRADWMDWTGDWTISLWAYFGSVTGDQFLWQQGAFSDVAIRYYNVGGADLLLVYYGFTASASVSVRWLLPTLSFGVSSRDQ